LKILKDTSFRKVRRSLVLDNMFGGDNDGLTVDVVNVQRGRNGVLCIDLVRLLNPQGVGRIDLFLRRFRLLGSFDGLHFVNHVIGRRRQTRYERSTRECNASELIGIQAMCRAEEKSINTMQITMMKTNNQSNPSDEADMAGSGLKS
jgi:hypothetical protein